MEVLWPGDGYSSGDEQAESNITNPADGTESVCNLEFTLPFLLWQYVSTKGKHQLPEAPR